MPAASPASNEPARVFVLRHAGWLDAVMAASRSDAPPGAQLADLAAALAASPAWKELPRARLVVRDDPPLLGLFGVHGPAEQARVHALWAQLQRREPWLRYVDYQQAERDCAALADRLTERLGHQELSRCRFTAVPRGGLIVLGMLAYVLGLDARQLAPAGPDDPRPVVVVDDCALSGLRFRDVLREVDAPRLVFAPLYATAALRDAIEAAEPRVLACVSGRDLRDLAPERLGDEYPAWRERWVARRRGEYWIGDPEHVAFAWNEPDMVLWNAVTDAAEDAWRFISPARCLKTRVQTAAAPRLTVLPATTGRLRPADDVVWAETEGGVHVAAASGASVLLHGMAAEMWRRIVETGERDGTLRALGAEYDDVDPARLRSDLDGFVTALVGRGLLLKDSPG